MCELILSDIWEFLCNFLHEKNKLENKLSKKQNRISSFRLTTLNLMQAIAFPRLMTYLPNWG